MSKWVPDWAEYFSIERCESGLEIVFYPRSMGCSNLEPIAALPKMLAVEDVRQQIRTKRIDIIGQNGNEGLHYEREKQPRYTGNDGLDHLDRSFQKLTKTQFWGAMRFTIEKYLDRLGKKDNPVKELEKVCDYAERWKKFEIERSKAN